MLKTPKINQIVKINTFDDGRQEYSQYKNEWRITKTMFNGGKIELINVEDKNVKINSISSWKVGILELPEKIITRLD
jgi:hypothetical protein